MRFKKILDVLQKLFSKGGKLRNGKFIPPNPIAAKRISSLQKLEQTNPRIWNSLAEKPLGDVSNIIKQIKTGKITTNDLTSNKKLSSTGTHVIKTPATKNYSLIMHNIMDPYSKDKNTLKMIANKVAKLKGETIQGEIMAGAEGIAIRTEKGRIIKFTKNPSEATSSMRARQRTTAKHVVKPYSVTNFTVNGQPTGYYVILMDEVTVLSSQERDIWNVIQSNFLESSYTNIDLLNKIKQQHDYNVFSSSNGQIPIENVMSFIKKILPQRKSIINDFKKLKIQSREAHSGNVGFDRNGRFKHFDFWSGNAQEPMIKKISRGSSTNINLDINLLTQFEK
jgi:hypothetical protein